MAESTILFFSLVPMIEIISLDSCANVDFHPELMGWKSTVIVVSFLTCGRRKGMAHDWSAGTYSLGAQVARLLQIPVVGFCNSFTKSY